MSNDVPERPPSMGSISDLRNLVEADGPFLTVLLPTPSTTADAAHRFDIEIRNALRDVPSAWDADVAEIHDELSGAFHGAGAGLVIVRPRGGPTLLEFIDDPVRDATHHIGSFPRLAPLIEARQRVVSHVVVDVDLAGADLIAFDGGSVVATGQVDGDTEHIHRGHPGGWSQRRFQQRAENTWDENVGDVADAVVAMVHDVGARIALVVGPTRAKSMVVGLLEERLDVAVRAVDAGGEQGAAAEIVRWVADVTASDTKGLLDTFAERIEHRAARADDVARALDQGRVETLLVHDPGTDSDNGRAVEFVDRCIAQALLTDAAVRVVPSVSALDQGVAAILRW